MWVLLVSIAAVLAALAEWKAQLLHRFLQQMQRPSGVQRSDDE